MGHAADDLPPTIIGLMTRPAVVDHDIAQDAHAAGVDIDLELHRVTAQTVGERRRNEVLHAFETRLESARQRIAGHAGHRFSDHPQRHAAARYAGDLDAAVAHFEIGGTCLQQMAATASAFSRTAMAAR